MRLIKKFRSGTLPVFFVLLLSISCIRKQANTVSIGDQVWSSKNLDVDTFRNGDPIPFVSDSAEWSTLKTGAWCYYEGIQDYGKIYGKLYNWHAVNDPRGLAPEGWKIPANDDWIMLVNHHEGKFLMGGKLKTDYLWEGQNKGATNETGFSALPAGGRRGTGQFAGFGTFTAFWTSDSVQGNVNNAWGWALETNNPSIGQLNFYRGAGFSVRLIRE